MSKKNKVKTAGKNGPVKGAEAWLYKNPAAIKSVRKGLDEAGAGKGEHVRDLKSFLNKL